MYISVKAETRVLTVRRVVLQRFHAVVHYFRAVIMQLIDQICQDRCTSSNTGSGDNGNGNEQQLMSSTFDVEVDVPEQTAAYDDAGQKQDNDKLSDDKSSSSSSSSSSSISPASLTTSKFGSFSLLTDVEVDSDVVENQSASPRPTFQTSSATLTVLSPTAGASGSVLTGVEADSDVVETRRTSSTPPSSPTSLTATTPKAAVAAITTSVTPISSDFTTVVEADSDVVENQSTSSLPTSTSSSSSSSSSSLSSSSLHSAGEEAQQHDDSLESIPDNVDEDQPSFPLVEDYGTVDVDDYQQEAERPESAALMADYGGGVGGGEEDELPFDEEEANRQFLAEAEARPPPPPPPTHHGRQRLPNVEDDERTGGHPLHHRQPCWDYEVLERQCLNGGRCFAVELHNGIRRSGCSCTSSWTGERCEMRYIDPSIWQELEAEENFRTAEVGSVTCLLLIVGFAFLSAVYGYRYKRRKCSWSDVVQVRDDDEMKHLGTFFDGPPPPYHPTQFRHQECCNKQQMTEFNDGDWVSVEYCSLRQQQQQEQQQQRHHHKHGDGLTLSLWPVNYSDESSLTSTDNQPFRDKCATVDAAATFDAPPAYSATDPSSAPSLPAPPPPPPYSIQRLRELELFANATVTSNHVTTVDNHVISGDSSSGQNLLASASISGSCPPPAQTPTPTTVTCAAT